MNKKGDALENWRIYAVTITILVIISLLIYVFYYLSWECRSDNECNQDEYCSVTHKCQKFTQQEPKNYILESLIIAIAIIISVVIYKKYNAK